jgi:hypothetical protein
MTAIAYPRPVSRQAMDIFAKEDPIFARLLVENGRVTVIDEQETNNGSKN